MSQYVTLAEAAPNVARAMPEFVPIGDIGVNTEWLGRLASFGGFYREGVMINNVTSEQPDVIFQGGNVNSQGALTATSVIAARRHEGFDSGGSGFRTRKQLTLGIDVGEVQGRLSRQGEVRKPATWARQFDQELRNGLRTAVWWHLVRGAVPSGDVASGAVCLVIEAATQAFSNSDSSLLESIIAISSAGVGTLAARLIGRRLWRSDTILSPVPFWQIDRAALVSIASRIGPPLVRAIQAPTS